ncbi:MAG: hypothetical protein HUK08_04225, partial [Bacteroidaceae bacterium]|nr:hypothetical protein [Bacteroidaceae bacterium]
MNKEKRIERLQKKLAEAEKEKRRLLRELHAKSKKSDEGNRSHERTGTIPLEAIKWYAYPGFPITMCLLLCVYAGCSPRCAAKVLEVFSFMLHGTFGKTPASTTIRTWLAKVGVYSLTHKPKNLEEAYALISDGSITVGDQQLMLTLKVPADHTGEALSHSNAEVVGLHVESSWPADKVKEHLDKVIEEQGHNPEYSISDYGPNLKKGFKMLGLPHHRDISHTFAIYLKKVYGNDVEFKEFNELQGVARSSRQ